MRQRLHIPDDDAIGGVRDSNPRDVRSDPAKHVDVGDDLTIVRCVEVEGWPSQQTTTSPVVVNSRIEVSYPAIAKSARMRGTVNVRVGVRPDGSVSETTVLEGVPLLSDAAVKATNAAAIAEGSMDVRQASGQLAVHRRDVRCRDRH